MLPESNGEGMDSSMILMLPLGHLATACLIMPEQVCSDTTGSFNPLPILSHYGFSLSLDSFP